MSGRYEELDDTPPALPVGFKPPPSMVEMIRMYVRRELSQAAGSVDAETFEEADDFDVEDDFPDPKTPYEAVFDPPPPPAPPNPDSGAGAGAASVPQGQALEPAAGSAAAGAPAAPTGS